MTQIRGLLKMEMPRERLVEYGPENLTEVELLAIILRVGTKNKNVLELSREILRKFNINQVSRKTFEELLEFKGISKAKACQVVSLFELSRRLSIKSIECRIKLTSSKTVFDYANIYFNNLPIEKVMAIFVDTKNHVIKKEFVHEGSINYSMIEPRNIIKKALSYDASGFFLLHNHPSGDVTPSEEDVNITRKIKGISENLEIRFLDHVIVGNEYYSFFDNGFL